MGYALHKEITVGPQGRILQTGLETFRVPLAQDVVPVNIVLHEGAPSIGPLGVKGAGEVPILNVPAAVACAAAIATGTRIQEISLTAPRMMAMMDGLKEDLHFPRISDNWLDNLLPGLHKS